MHSIDDNIAIGQEPYLSLSESAASGLVLIRTSLRKDVCSTPNRPFLTAIDDQQKRVLMYRPGCKLWSCPECAQHNRRQWTARIANGVRQYQETENQPWWFVTLSTHEKLRGFDRQLHVWRNAWPKLLNRIHRVSVGQLRYVLLPELAPETERFHAHALINQSFGAKPSKSRKNAYSCAWLHDNPRECGLGYANDIKPIESPAAAAAYTAGYIGKALGVTDWPTNFRRIRTSNSWPELPEQPNQGDLLSWVHQSAAQFTAQVESAWRLGYEVVNVTTGEMFEVIDLPEVVS